MKTCSPKDIATKSFFLGPKSENGEWLRSELELILTRWFKWRKTLYPEDGAAISKSDLKTPAFLDYQDKTRKLLIQLLGRFENEIPKFSPRYAGHMFSEISLPALLGHIVTLLHNPNNVSGESSKVGIEIENEAIQFLREMVGFPTEVSAGHFCSGGSIANYEALIRARERLALWLSAGVFVNSRKRNMWSLFEAAHMGWNIFEKIKFKSPNKIASFLKDWSFTESNPWVLASRFEKVFGMPFLGPVVLVPENKHYSWKKGIGMLGLGASSFWPLELDFRGKLSIPYLKKMLIQARVEFRPVLMVVSVAGTTELGEIDPIQDVQNLLDEWRVKHKIHIWHHVDAAYGGFFCCLNKNKIHPTALLSKEATQALKSISRVNSVTLDPHKLGYVPFSSGSFLVRENRDYGVKAYQAPYLQLDLSKDKGPYTIEGSRSAAGAVATWMTAQSIGLNAEGYGRIIERTIRAKRELENLLINSQLPIRIAPFTDTNILCFAVAHQKDLISRANQRTLAIYDAFSPKGDSPFIVSKTKLNWASYSLYLDHFIQSWEGKRDADELVLIRMCLMNPFFNSKETRVEYPKVFLSHLKKLMTQRVVSAI